MHKNFGEFGRVTFELCERTDRQTDTLIVVLRSSSGGDVTTEKFRIRCGADSSLLAVQSVVRTVVACGYDQAAVHEHCTAITRPYSPK